MQVLNFRKNIFNYNEWFIIFIYFFPVIHLIRSTYYEKTKTKKLKPDNQKNTMFQSKGCLKNFNFLICFKACLLIYLIPSPELFVQNIYKVRSTLSGCLQVRTGHSTEATSVDCITAGTQVTVLSSVPFWREISYDNKTGLVAKKFIELVETATTIDHVANQFKISIRHWILY